MSVKQLGILAVQCYQGFPHNLEGRPSQCEMISLTICHSTHPTEPKQRGLLSPTHIWTEICSYLKGSVEAVKQPTASPCNNTGMCALANHNGCARQAVSGMLHHGTCASSNTNNTCRPVLPICHDSEGIQLASTDTVLQGHLDLAQYEGLGRKRAATFTSEQRRDLVWPVFQAYQQALRAEGRWTWWPTCTGRSEKVAIVAPPSLLCSETRRHCQQDSYIDGASSEDLPAPHLHWLQVSHTHKHTHSACHTQPSSSIPTCLGPGMLPAQAMFYELSQAQQAAIRDAKKARQGHRLAGAPAVVGVPQIQQLLINHRTHQGILNAAAVVVDALKHHYPAGIDSLARERAHFQGPGPVLEGSLSSTDIRPLLQQAGAQKVFLLRDRSQRHELPEYLRKSNALMLTVPQAKGLEFEEVFMVDFFKHSPAPEAEWRVLNSFCPAGAQPSSLRSTKFDPSVHLLLQEELKMLYTAITRARCHVRCQ
ncbi:TPR and ankyrin repeat-containing protein 1 [Haematococcus lacustris]|uniref:TPR and ankyrin repeat-containing protein 1 n=1 Tax=Haematococcus lacustris TaxID=44745 RepID=A0A699YSR2_HAELA|nr:TPR and ankyrin repeat-containing protein 1 [Haematococcus lacustris]